MDILKLNQILIQDLSKLEILGEELALKARNFGVLKPVMENEDGQMDQDQEEIVSTVMLRVDEMNMINETIKHTIESMERITEMARNWQYTLEK